MISFDSFVMEEGVPLYQQILLYVKRGIAGGTIQDGDELPSRRVLSALLGVNPNTGAKSCVVLEAGTTRRVREQLLEQDARALITAMRQMGLTKSEAVTLIETYWE